MMVEFTIPLTKNLIVSEANRGSEHWTQKHKRHKTQRLLIEAYLNKSVAHLNILPCQITLTRIAPRFLDAEENLPMAFKSIKDYIANFLIPGKRMGQADSDKRIQWAYNQIKGEVKEYAINVKIKNISHKSESI